MTFGLPSALIATPVTASLRDAAVQHEVPEWGQYRSADDVRRTTALTPQADLAGSRHGVRDVPKPAVSDRDKRRNYSITSSARNKSDVGMDIPSA
jgi:hypothetical protein